MPELNILVLEDEERLLEEITEYLETNGFTVYKAARPTKGMGILLQEKIDIAIIDIRLPEYSGIEFLERMKKTKPDIEAIMMSGHGDVDMVIDAMRRGAYDFLQKPFAPLDLKIAIERTSKYVQLQERAQNLETACNTLHDEIMAIGDVRIVGVSPAIRETADMIEAVSGHPDSRVLITGESGTGKELAARLIHLNSPRKMERFVPVNCAAIPGQLSESEFFGHTKGAFTDARDTRKGYFRTADKGTLFLDEIGDMSYELQTKLLRVIEEKIVQPVGSDEEIPVDVRVLCATNRKLDELLADGGFRLDLYHRISVFDIHIPPLRERPEDIPVLVSSFLQSLSEKMGKRPVPPDPVSTRALLSYQFPGNVRELKNIVEKAVIVGHDPAVFDVPSAFGTARRAAAGEAEKRGNAELPTLRIDELEKHAIQAALEETRGNMTKAAALLGISRQALDRRLLKYGSEAG
jgi:DNA-binding NtrC family response regulator